MAGELQINITAESVSVRLDVKPKTRFYALAFFILFIALLTFGITVLPDKHGESALWQDLSTWSFTWSDFEYPLGFFVGMLIFMVAVQGRYVRYAYPSAETFHCDRSGLTISKVRWLDVHNKHWVTRFYSIAELQDVRYGRLALSKGAAIYGLRFNTGIDAHKALPGLEPRDAQKILMAMKSFGAHVPDDPKLQRKVEEVHA